MLPAPGASSKLHPAYEPVMRLCNAVLLTPAEVAKHYRYRPEHVQNMRHRGKGPAWVKLGPENGAIRYRLSELIAWEIHGHRGGWTFERVSLALATVPGMTAEWRQVIENHLCAVLDSGNAPE